MEFFRNFAKSRFGQFSMLLFLAPMAFLGMNNHTGTHAPDEIVQIGDSSIGLSQLQTAIGQRRQQLIAGGIDSSLIKDDAVREQVLENLINRALLEEQSKKLGLVVSDNLITEQLKSFAEFKDADGKFSNDLFAAVLQNNHLTKKQLFEQRRKELSVDQITSGVSTTSIYPLSTIEKLIKLQSETRDVWLHRVSWQDFMDEIKVTDDEVKKYYDQHESELKSIPMVDLSYIKLSSDLVKVDAPTDEEIAIQYELYKEENNLVDMRQLSQILLTGKDAEKKAKEIKAKLDSGEDFAKMAKEFSQDPTSADGGNIGRFNPDVFEKEDAELVENALKDLKVGEISDFIKTKFGYQIFTVTSDDGKEIPTLESLKDTLIEKAIDYKKKTVFTEKITAINSKAMDGYGISDIAAEENLKVEVIKNYQKDNNLSELGQPVVIEKAFDEFLIQDQSVSSSIELNDSMVWIQPSNYRPTDVMSLKEATSMIKSRLEQQKGTEIAFKHAKNIAKLVKSEEDLIKEKGQYTRLGEINRQNSLLTKDEIRIAFANKSKDLLAKVTKTESGASVVVINPSKDTKSEQLAGNEKKQVVQTVRTRYGQNELLDYLDYLNKVGDVEIDHDKINKSEDL